MTRSHVVRAGLLAIVLAVVASLFVVAPAEAGNGGDVSAGCSGSACSVSVSYSGTAVNRTGGGSGSVGTVAPDCWFEKWANPQDAFAQAALLNFFFPVFLLLPVDDIGTFAKVATDPKYKDYNWYWLKCREGVNVMTSDAAMGAAGTTDWFGRQVAKMTMLIGPGEEPPPGGVSIQTLLEAAQQSMQIPDPVVERNPTMRGTGATLVNLNTLFWSDTAQQDQSITASAGPVSVTITAKPKGYQLSSPVGGASCTAAQFATPWTQGMNESSGCGLVFSRASAGGWPVTVSSTWDASFTATGMAGSRPLDPVTASTTVDVPVNEVQSVVQSTN